MIRRVQDAVELDDTQRSVFAHHYLPVVPRDRGHVGITQQDTWVAFAHMAKRANRAAPATFRGKRKPHPPTTKHFLGPRVYRIDDPPPPKPDGRKKLRPSF